MLELLCAHQLYLPQCRSSKDYACNLLQVSYSVKSQLTYLQSRLGQNATKANNGRYTIKVTFLPALQTAMPISSRRCQEQLPTSFQLCNPSQPTLVWHRFRTLGRRAAAHCEYHGSTCIPCSIAGGP